MLRFLKWLNIVIEEWVEAKDEKNLRTRFWVAVKGVIDRRIEKLESAQQ